MKAVTKNTPPNLSAKTTEIICAEMTNAYQDHEKMLLRRALYKTNNQETSEDLVQVTFLKTLQYLQKGGKIALMRGFLNHVMSDLIVDEYRKNKNISLDDLMGKGFELGADDRQRHIDFFDGKYLILLIPQLPEKYQLVIRLRYLNGLSLKEMALVTGQTENTVAVQAHRGVGKLRELYMSTHDPS